MSNFVILNFFKDTFLLGLTFGLTSTFSIYGFILFYILSSNKNFKTAFHDVIFLFLGRLLSFMLLASIAVMLKSNTLVFYLYDSSFVYYISVLSGLLILILGVLVFINKIPLDYPIMFIIGLLLGLTPDVTFKVFLSNLNLTISNKFLALSSGFIFGAASFISLLIIFAVMLGWMAEFISTNFPKLYNSIQKICGLIIIYLGFEQIVKMWISLIG